MALLARENSLKVVYVYVIYTIVRTLMQCGSSDSVPLGLFSVDLGLGGSDPFSLVSVNLRVGHCHLVNLNKYLPEYMYNG